VQQHSISDHDTVGYCFSIVYKIILLLTTKIQIFHKTNKALSKYYRTKKTRVRQGNIPIIEDARDVLVQKNTEE
jgi:hypothetical protein